MNRRILPALLLLSAGCATTPPPAPEAPAPAPPKMITTEVQFINRSPFDVGTCQMNPAAPELATEGTITGALMTTAPLLKECLVDPKTRGPAQETTVVVDTTVSPEGTQHQVSGTNLTPEGSKCVEDALARAVKLPTLEKGEQPAKGQIQLKHVANVDPTVTWGANDPSDIAGAVRLAMPSLCECFASYTDRAPATLKGSISVLKSSSAVAEVQWESEAGAAPAAPEGAPPAATPQPQDEAGELAKCMSAKLQKLPLAKEFAEDWKVPYTFEFIHSGGGQAAANASSELLFRHLNAQSIMAQAQSNAASGVWLATRERFNTLVARYNKEDPKVTYSHVKKQCGARVRTSEAWLAKLDEQLSVEKRLVTLVQELAAKDSGWAEVVTQRGATVAQVETDRAQAQQHRDAEVAACKKLR